MGILSKVLAALATAPAVTDAARVIVTHNSSSNSVAGFSCPAECSQCCGAHSWDIGIASWGLSEKKYKCVLRNKNVKPSDKCSEPEQRTYSENQYKTECPFENLKDKPWETLEKTPCVKSTRCCCDAADSWTEKKCLSSTASRVEAASEDSRANGEKQMYEKARYQMYRNTEACKGPGEALQYQTSRTSSMGTHGKCCRKTTPKKDRVEVPGSCGMRGGYWCDHDMCMMDPDCNIMDNMCGQHRECDYKDVHWTACATFESLHTCSSDEGVTNNGQSAYLRVPPGKGTCRTDLKDNGRCPSGFKHELVLGKECQCEDQCGR